MKLHKSGLIVLSSIVGLLFLGACSSGTTTSNSNSSPAASNSGATSQPESSIPVASTSTSTAQPESSIPIASTSTSTKSDHPSKGGQVVESGPYHLELVTAKEANGTHIDFYLQTGDNHQPIPNAKVTAQIQMPDGTQKALNLTYDAAGKHYAVLLPGMASGQYQVRMTADINGQKVSGRFNFNR